MKELPKDWKWIKLQDVCQKIIDGSHNPPKSKDKGLPMLSAKDVFDNKIHFDNPRLVSDDDFVRENKRTNINSGDVLLTIVATIGRTAVVPMKAPKFTLQRSVAVLKTQENSHFLCYAFQTPKFQQQLRDYAKGTAQKGIYLKTLSQLEIPLAPKPIQHAIVSKIEELFSELDKGIENLRLAQQQLKTYRQSVLKWAFEGRLTNENVKEGELPEGWKLVQLGEVSKISGGLTKNAKRQNLELQLPFLRVANVYFNSLDLDNMHTIGINSAEIERVRLEKDDLLFVEGNGSLEQIGRVALWNGAIKDCVHQNHLIKSRLSKQVDPKYALYFFCSKIGRDRIKEQANSTSGLHTLSLGKISKLLLPLCEIAKQHKIVDSIEGRLSISDKMEESISESLQQAEALKQSVLKKAFEGKLTATDTIEIVKQSAKVIPLERKVLACKIIHLLHEDKYFGLTKFQKILYTVENFAEVKYETNFLQDRAGPHDKDFTTAFRKEMQEKDWFAEEQKGSMTKFIPGEKVGSLIKDYAKYFRDKSSKIVYAVQHLKDKSTHEAELIATLYAVWNNRLIKKKPIKIELLVEDFFNWSPKKKEEFQEVEIVDTYKWLKKIKMTPSGFGKVIE